MKIMKIFNTYNCNLLKHFRINQFIKKNIFLRLHKNISHISTINSNNMGELNITKSIENLKIYHENKFACLLIECLYCNNKKLYVNKITGRFICTHCMRVGEWSSCEEYLQSHKNSKANFIPTPKIFEAEQYFKKISNTLIHFSALSVGTKKSILKALDVEVLFIISLRKLPQELLPSLENYNKLILWFENDQIAWNSARTFAKKFVESRCYFIRPVNDQPSPYIAFKQDLNIEKIIKTADKMVHPSIINFSTIRKEVFAELQNHDKALGIKWSNFPILNKTLGGHRRGELTILTGPTGSGKTTFISEYSLDLTKQGLPTLWGSFEIRNQRLGKIMLQQFAKEPIHLNLNLFDALADEFEKLPLYFMTFHGSQPLNTVMDAVLNAAYVYDIGHVVIDNVQFMMGIGSKYNMGSERFWQQDTVIAEFRNFATYTNCHVTLVIHPRKEKDVEQLSISSIFGTAKATQEADNILIIQNKTLESLQIKKYLQVVKNRYNGNLGIMPLEFDKHSLSFSQSKN
ncbi:mitochondrial DNA helicase isoform X3 [Daktulosphaira vitifoliae]|uniref:mitochondrial DNA helicase isoform X3 n=1 Tax=Daktulosphaira vitifoliae TaxID=58002 RepID=UPI0021A99BB3|nr:mitochondrial DNA helicase isoform X3 [Daktulosphaira vitifoliae]